MSPFLSSAVNFGTVAHELRIRAAKHKTAYNPFINSLSKYKTRIRRQTKTALLKAQTDGFDTYIDANITVERT
jgi:hypothetical protein